MVNVLWITAIGMGLVFAVILLLWGLMALLVRLTAEKPARTVFEPEGEAEAVVVPASTEGLSTISDLRRKAAAAAVAFALSRQQQDLNDHTDVESTRSTLSAWQAVQRASQLSQRNQAPRKQVIR